MSSAATIYVLIALSSTGVVTSSKYETQHLCDEAKSVLLYHKTIEEKDAADAADKAYWAEQKAKELQFEAEHPPRQPVGDEKERSSGDVASSCDWSRGKNVCRQYRVLESGLIQDEMPADQGHGWGINNSGWSVVYPGENTGPYRGWCMAEVPGEPTP